MKCPKCQKNVQSLSNYCEFCGHAIKLESTAANIQMPSINPKEGLLNKRVGRKHYWATLLVYGVLTGLVSQFEKEGGVSFGESADALISILWFFALGYYLFVILWRFNDLGKSKWYILGLLIPIVNIILGFGLAFEKGKLHITISEQAK